MKEIIEIQNTPNRKLLDLAQLYTKNVKFIKITSIVESILIGILVMIMLVV